MRRLTVHSRPCRALIFCGLLLFTCLVCADKPAEAPPLPRGDLVPSVICLKDPEFSYALYLPSSYTPDKEWPLILAFSPGANGANPVRLLMDAAEQYGRIGPLALQERQCDALAGQPATHRATEPAGHLELPVQPLVERDDRALRGPGRLAGGHL